MGAESGSFGVERSTTRAVSEGGLSSLRRSVARFPFERALVMGVAAVVGLYGGIAAGLFATAIQTVQLILFRGDEVVASLWRPEWAERFRVQLALAHWHLEFAALAALILGAALLLQSFGKRLPMFEVRRLRSVALAAALGLSLYYPLLLLQTFNRTFHETEGGLYALLLQSPRLVWVVAPALGALLAVLIVRFSPESGGHGVVEVIEAVHKRGQIIRGRVAFWKSMAAGLVIGSGGSAGREGPVVHLGGAVASSLSRMLGLPRSEASLLLAAGAGAGIAGSFQAPLAGSLFALEIVLGDFDVRRFAPVVLACVTAVATSRALLGGGTELRTVSWQLNHPSEIGIYLVLGLVAGVCGIVYIRCVHEAEHRFARLPWRPELRAALGGLLVGFIGLLAPRVMGTGIESMNAALAGQLTFGTLLLALFAKLVATSFTLGSGSPGGSFFPAVFIGAMLGGAFGQLAHLALPSITAGADAYAAVGMGAVVAGATLAPLTGVLMMFELTGSYQIVLPLLVACGTATVVVQGVLGGSIYQLGARRRGIRLGLAEPSLRELSVAQAVDKVEALPAEMPFPELMALVGSTTHAAFPVISGAELVGVLSVRETRRALLDPAVDRASTARTFTRETETFLVDDDLGTVVQRLTKANAAEGLVLDGDRKPIGVVTREGILEAWHRATIPRET
jgi:CIC family chloride channel protein